MQSVVIVVIQLTLQVEIKDIIKEIGHGPISQTEDKVHGLRRGFFYAKVSQTQYLSRIEAFFVL